MVLESHRIRTLPNGRDVRRRAVTRQSVKVSDLAREAGMDLDEALVTLWDAGLGELDGPASLIPKKDVSLARRSLGLVGAREQQSVEYWIRVSGLEREELSERLAVVGVHLPPAARRIPKGSLRRLRSLFEERILEAEPHRVGQEELAPLVWETVGSTPVARYLTEEEIEQIHVLLEKDFATSGDPISPPGVKERGLLSSAAHRAQTSMGGDLKYETAEMAGAALFHSVVLNHAFFNGNKRTGLVALIAFLNAHKLVFTCTRDELFKLTLRVAAHGLVPMSADQLADREVIEIARWIRSHTRTLEFHERPMQWFKLRRRLRELGCDSEPASGRGNRLNIYRVIEERSFLGLRAKTRTLRCQVGWSGDGTEAPKNLIHKIRTDLRLDDAHGFDSRAFYEDARIDDFITEYRDILQRLSRL